MTVIIVGAGVIGCAVAHALARRGARVHVVDARGPAGGATRASAGILSPYIEAHDETLLSLCVRSLEAYDAFMTGVRADSTRQVPYERAGTLQVAGDDAEAAALERLAGELRDRRVGHALLGRAAVRRLEPAIDASVAAGLLVDQHGYVAARALTLALVDGARRHGATFRRCRVTAIEAAAEGVRVATGTTMIQGDAVVIAAGSWSAQLAPGAPPAAVTPVRGQLVQLRLDAPLTSRVIWGARGYLVPWPDGTVLVGATVEDAGFDERSTAGGVASLLDAACALVPALHAATVQRVRVGLRPATADGWPIVGRSSRMPGVHYATGHYRTGVLLAPVTATLMADLVLDGRAAAELAPFAPARLDL